MRISLPQRSFADLFDGWVNPSIVSGSEDFSTHARFIGISVCLAAVSVILAPIVLVSNILLPQSLSFLICLFLFASTAAAFVSRTANLRLAQTAALVGIAASVVLISTLPQVPTSFCLIALAIVPLEATIWRMNRSVVIGSFIALIGLLAVILLSGGIGQVAGEVGSSNAHWMAKLGVAYAIFTAYRFNQQFNDSERQSRQEAERFKAISQNSGELITRHKRDGSTLFASCASRRLLGVSADELVGSGLFEKIHLQDRIHFLKAISDAGHSGSDQNCTVRIRYRGDGNVLWRRVDIRARAFDSEQGGNREIVCAMRDVTRENELALELEEALSKTDQFSRSQRQFLAKMSHELRTPLNSIIGFSDILRSELFGKLPYERHAEYVELIQDSGQHLLNVVNDMLDMARIDAGKYELSLSTFAMNDVVDSTVKMLQPIAEKKSISVLAKIDDKLPQVTADRRACQQILINLVSNAVKFSPENAHVAIGVKPFGRSFKISVKDNGIGIDNDLVNKVGEPFVQGDSGNDRQFEGSGLGLSVVKGLVEVHEGEFKIKSIKGEGTEVTVTLPVTSRVSRPVPGSETNELVHLGKVKASESDASKAVTSSVNEGEGRARLSA